MEFELKTDYIELIKLLKLLNMAESGSVAKMLVENGMVRVNGKAEWRKRKKLRIGDVVRLEDQTIKIIPEQKL